MNIAILLCTKNGSSYIKEQLVSIAKQEFSEIDLYISDNNSNDGTREKIHAFIKENKNMNIFFNEGKDLHFAKNFVYLAQTIEKNYSYYAFCDQDDIWDENHLSRALSILNKQNSSIPLLYCSRTSLINKHGVKIGKSQKFSKRVSFQNAIVQSIAGGNTMIFNKESFELLSKVSIDLEIVSHDWLLYILVTGAGGKVTYEFTPSVNYRQHDKNIIGSNKGFLSKVKRLGMLLDGTFKKYNLINFAQLDHLDILTQTNQVIYKSYKKSFSGSVFSRIKNFIKSGVYRQSLMGDFALIISILANIMSER